MILTPDSDQLFVCPEVPMFVFIILEIIFELCHKELTLETVIIFLPFLIMLKITSRKL